MQRHEALRAVLGRRRQQRQLERDLPLLLAGPSAFAAFAAFAEWLHGDDAATSGIALHRLAALLWQWLVDERRLPAGGGRGGDGRRLRTLRAPRLAGVPAAVRAQPGRSSAAAPAAVGAPAALAAASRQASSRPRSARRGRAAGSRSPAGSRGAAARIRRRPPTGSAAPRPAPWSRSRRHRRRRQACARGACGRRARRRHFFAARCAAGASLIRPSSWRAECSARRPPGCRSSSASARKSRSVSSGFCCSLWMQNSTLSFWPG
jgi:hypothetical protein